jgi:hypothetical protein
MMQLLSENQYSNGITARCLSVDIVLLLMASELLTPWPTELHGQWINENIPEEGSGDHRLNSVSDIPNSGPTKNSQPTLVEVGIDRNDSPKFTPKTSANVPSPTDNTSTGIIFPRPSVYASYAFKSQFFRIAAHCSAKLDALTSRASRLHTLKTRILAV